MRRKGKNADSGNRQRHRSDRNPQYRQSAPRVRPETHIDNVTRRHRSVSDEAQSEVRPDLMMRGRQGATSGRGTTPNTAGNTSSQRPAVQHWVNFLSSKIQKPIFCLYEL